jgi:hypothetical protein
MEIKIAVESWHLAHYLAGKCADAAYSYRQLGLEQQAKFFDRTARAITKQAEPLNWMAWHARRGL